MKPKGARQVPGAFSAQKTGLQNATVYCNNVGKFKRYDEEK
jgi:hypothetical protein